MYMEEFMAAANAAKAKSTLLKENGAGYMASAMLAGAYIGFGILLIFTIGGLLNGQPYAKIVMGLSFGIALSLVVIAGAELFTGNNLVMAAGIFKGTVTAGQAAKLWIVCYIGNWIGSIILAALFYFGGFATGDVGAFIANAAAAKMSVPLAALFIRGMLCNILVCVGVMCALCAKDVPGRAVGAFCPVCFFVVCGFEHCIANLYYIPAGLFARHLPQYEALALEAGADLSALNLTGFLLGNLLPVTLGNLLGGCAFAALMWYGHKKDYSSPV